MDEQFYYPESTVVTSSGVWIPLTAWAPERSTWVHLSLPLTRKGVVNRAALKCRAYKSFLYPRRWVALGALQILPPGFPEERLLPELPEGKVYCRDHNSTWQRGTICTGGYPGCFGEGVGQYYKYKDTKYLVYSTKYCPVCGPHFPTTEERDDSPAQLQAKVESFLTGDKEPPPFLVLKPDLTGRNSNGN